MRKLALLLCLFASVAFGQVYSATLTAPGSGFVNAPTVSSSGGGCSVQPTFAATIAGGLVTAVNPTFIGTGCTSAPTLSISGGSGTGATATANIIPATILIFEAIPSLNGAALNPGLGASNIAWHYGCELAVPKARVPFYAGAQGAPYRMPGTLQTSAGISALIGGFPGAVATAYQAAWASGVLTEFSDFYISNSSVTVANVEAAIVAACAAQQTNLNGWNPWMGYGTFYNGASWTVQGYQ